MINRLFQLFVATLPVVLLGAALVLTQRPAIAADSPAASGPNPMQSLRGAQTWANNCARCHNMRDPREMRDDQWRAVIAHMRVRASLTGQEARDVLAFLQAANDERVTPPSLTAPLVPVAVNDEIATAPDGQSIYSQTCIVCHGADGKGAIPGVTDFTAKDSPLSKSDAELLKNVSEGFQSPGSFMAMPPKGGNPTLTEAGVRAVLNYLRAEFGE